MKKSRVLALTLTSVALLAAPAFSKPPARVVDVTVDQHGFSPNRIDAKRDQKLTLRFTRKSDKGCATSVAFPELHIKKPLPLDKPVTIEIPTDKANTYGFTCGMGMYESSVVIQ